MKIRKKQVGKLLSQPFWRVEIWVDDSELGLIVALGTFLHELRRRGKSADLLEILRRSARPVDAVRADAALKKAKAREDK